jgi:hypothetical protein
MGREGSATSNLPFTSLPPSPSPLIPSLPLALSPSPPSHSRPVLFPFLLPHQQAREVRCVRLQWLPSTRSCTSALNVYLGQNNSVLLVSARRAPVLRFCHASSPACATTIPSALLPHLLPRSPFLSPLYSFLSVSPPLSLSEPATLRYPFSAAYSGHEPGGGRHRGARRQPLPVGPRGLRWGHQGRAAAPAAGAGPASQGLHRLGFRARPHLGPPPCHPHTESSLSPIMEENQASSRGPLCSLASRIYRIGSSCIKL